MCGICGLFNLRNGLPSLQTLMSMTSSLGHRGPDGSGTWVDPAWRVHLGQTRLAIIDIPSGKQPMQSADGRYVIVFNGEIYNYQSLRSELQQHGHAFRTSSDTEVLMVALIQWGRAALKRLRGMFAFAFFDTVSGHLLLARDPVGIKPLYYYSDTERFIFGSEPKAILTAGVPRQLNYKALVDFFVLGYPLVPNTLFLHIHELEPGTWLEVSSSGATRGRYWSWTRNETNWSESLALANTEQSLLDSLQEHLVSDVPLGAFLSGGIDSSLLVALLVKVLGVDLDTFNVRFGESRYDESPYARAVAKHLGTHHHEILIDAADADILLVDSIHNQFDQPFADSSAIPTYLISKEIRKHVRVVIGGDGGDEMFGGYRRFYHADVAQALGRMPRSLLGVANATAYPLGVISPTLLRQSDRFFRAVRNRNPNRLLALSCYNYPERLPSVLRPEILSRAEGYWPSLCPPDHLMSDPGGREFIDATISYALPGDYLRKVDFMSSAHGLEVRVPFLGSQVLDCAARLPNRLRYSARANKIMLRKLAERYLPQTVARKPKAGFGIPLDSWLGTQGREELKRSLGSPSARIRDFVQPQWIDALLDIFVKGTWDEAVWSRFMVYQQVYMLWSLEQWLNHWKPTS